MSNTQTATAKDPFIIRLENVRLSYPALFEAKGMEGSKPKFSAVFLLRKKEHKDTIARIEKLVERAALEKFGKKVTLKHTVLHDGNEKEDKEGYGDEVMYLTAKSDTRPAVVDQKKVTVTAEDGKVYAGCYVNASIQLFAYKHPTGGNGVSASLRAVQFVKDGESFGAAPVNPDDEFEEVGADADL